MRHLVPVLLLVGACQEFRIDSGTDKPDDPIDTDAGLGALQPDIEVTPAELRFGTMTVDCLTSPQTVTIQNVGDSALEVTDIRIQGRGNLQFQFDGKTQRTLYPTQQMTVDITFAPDTTATFEEAKVTVFSDDPDEAQVRVPLSGTGADFAEKEELFVQGPEKDVDVVFVVDNSESISSERQKIVNALQQFISNYSTLGLDFHLGITTTDMSDPATGGLFLGDWIDGNTNDPVGKIRAQLNSDRAQPTELANEEKGFDASYAAVTSKLNQGFNQGFLRDDATLAVAVVSDEDDASTDYGLFGGAVDYADDLQALKPNPDDVTFSAMVGPDNNKLVACGGGLLSPVQATGAKRYHTAIRRTGGTWVTICQLDFTPFITYFSYVAAGLEYRFPLAETPLSYSPTAMTVTVDGQPVPFDAVNGWTFDEDANAVQLNGTAIPGPGGTVVVTYPYDAAGCFDDSGTP